MFNINTARLADRKLRWVSEGEKRNEKKKWQMMWTVWGLEHFLAKMPENFNNFKDNNAEMKYS